MDSQFFVAMILSNASHHLISQIAKPLNHNFFEVWCENFQPLFKIQLEIGQWTLFYQFYCVNQVGWGEIFVVVSNWVLKNHIN
jgi:hypothetical protein